MHVCEYEPLSSLCSQDEECRQRSVHACGRSSGRFWRHESACRGSAPLLFSDRIFDGGLT